LGSSEACVAGSPRWVLLTNSAVVKTAHVIKRSLRGSSARLFVEGWRDALPMLLGDEGIA
jgi:hypothetical protein